MIGRSQTSRIAITAAPVYMDEGAKCRHQWIVEFSKEPDDLQRFAELLDRYLQEVNSDYEAKRHKDITLQPLEIVVARHNLFNDWLKMKGKLGGQHKVPRQTVSITATRGSPVER